MRYFTVAFIFLLFYALRGFSQDLIVTHKGDSLKCKIIEIKEGKISYSFSDSENRNFESEIEQSRVKYFAKKFYSQDSSFSQSVSSADSVFDSSTNYKIRINIAAGLSRMTGRTSSQVPSFLNSYVDKLKTGYNFSADFGYYFYDWIGVGAKGTVFRTQNEMRDIVIIYDNGTVRQGMIKDDITTMYIGPSICTRSLFRRNAGIFTGISFGYITYKNYATLIDDFTMRSNTLGAAFDIGCDFPSSNSASFGIGISYIFGVLNYIDIDDGSANTTRYTFTREQLESVSRLDFTVAIRFRQ